jgi:hypothetical protein
MRVVVVAHAADDNITVQTLKAGRNDGRISTSIGVVAGHCACLD